jgi:hypothetical protein
LNQLQRFGSARVELGVGGIELFPSEDIVVRQVGYSVAANGSTLSASARGGWNSRWLVIGQDLCVGDPIFIDMDNAQSPVMTAVHGDGEWNPVVISKSSEGLFAIMQGLADISLDRSDPDHLKAHPIAALERQKFLNQVKQWTDTEDAEDFWLAQLGDNEPKD